MSNASITRVPVNTSSLSTGQPVRMVSSTLPSQQSVPSQFQQNSIEPNNQILPSTLPSQQPITNTFQPSQISTPTQFQQNSNIPNSQMTNILSDMIPQSPLNRTGNDVLFTTNNVSSMSYITLPENINIYYGTTRLNTFDPNDIKLSDNTLLALFSNNPKLAADNFMSCSNFPGTKGYLHQFRIKKDIPYIQLIHSASLNDNYSLTQLDKTFCQRSQNPKLNGFAYSIKRLGNFNTETYDYIIGLCNPNEYLEYVSSSNCIGKHRLTTPSNIFV